MLESSSTKCSHVPLSQERGGPFSAVWTKIKARTALLANVLQAACGIRPRAPSVICLGSLPKACPAVLPLAFSSTILATFLILICILLHLYFPFIVPSFVSLRINLFRELTLNVPCIFSAYAVFLIPRISS